MPQRLLTTTIPLHNCQRMIKLWLVCGLLLMSGCASIHHPAPEEPVTALFQHDASPTSMHEVVQTTANSTFTLIGESHTNAAHHMLQATLLEELAKTGYKFVIGLEMVDITMQNILDKFYRAEISLADLPEQLDWKNKWGYDFELYRPIFAVAQRYKIPLAALNVPSPLIRTVSNSGLAEAQSIFQEEFPKHILPASPLHEKRLRAFYEPHILALQVMGKKHKGTVDSFLLIQSIWDSAMAENALKAQRHWQRSVVILAGSGHVEYGFGISDRLKTLDLKATVVLIVPVGSEELAVLHKQKYSTQPTPDHPNSVNTTNSQGALPMAAAQTDEQNHEPLPPLGDFLFYTGNPRKLKP